MERSLVVYHEGCADGAVAALAARSALPDALLLEKPAGAPLAERWCPPAWTPAEEPDRVTAYYLALAPEPEDLHFLQTVFRGGPQLRVVVIDHHATTAERLEEGGYDGLCQGTTELGFRLSERSGAMAAVQHFGGEPALVCLAAFVEDRDLWRWQLPQSREVSAYLSTLPTDPANLHLWTREVEEIRDDGVIAWREKAAAVGHYLLAQQRRLVERQAAKARLHRHGARLIAVTVNATVLIDETCELLLERHPEAQWAAAWRVDGDCQRRWSLRSRVGSPVDVKRIARGFGGGGHMHAAGFVERPGQSFLEEA